MINKTPILVVLVVLGQTLSGCGDSHVQPSPVPPPGATVVRGVVRDTALSPIAGAVVEILDGPQAGRSATTDPQGLFSLTGTIDDTTQFRATKIGYATATATARSSCVECAGRQITFELVVLAPTVNVTGNYTLTFIADSACTALPSDVRTRTYPVTITPAGTGAFYNLAVDGASINDLGYPPIGVSGDVVQFAFVDDHNLPYLVEQVAPDARLEITGYAEASIGTSGVSTIATSFSGSIDYIGPQIVRCSKTNHRLILTRQ